MKRRFVYFILILAFFFFSCCVFSCITLALRVSQQSQANQNIPVASSTPSSSTATPAPEQSTPLPSFPEHVALVANSVEDIFLAPFWAIAKVTGLFLATIMVAYFIAWVVELGFQRQLVMADFESALDQEMMNQSLKGISLEARSMLTKQLDELAKVVRNNIKQQGTREYTPGEPQLPADTTDEKLTQMIGSLKDSSPDAYKPLINILGMVIPTRGTLVSSTLLHRGLNPGTVGVAFKLSDISGANFTAPITLWESVSQKRDIFIPEVSKGSENPEISPARLLFQIANILFTAGFYQDALEYINESLQLSPASKDISEKRTEVQLAIQGFERNMADIALADKLVEGGKPEIAIEYYLNPINAKSHEKTRRLLETVLEINPEGNKGLAYCTLADLYRAIQFNEVASSYYLQAIKNKSRDARKKREQMLHEQATSLTEVAQVLYNLGRFSSANMIINRALERQPDATAAISLSKSIKQNLPPEVSNEARASFKLGEAYAGSGNLEKALELYETALSKQPEYKDAYEAAKEALNELSPLRDRYINLLDPLTRAVALEITRREILKQHESKPGNVQKRNMTKGQIHNFFGALYQASSLDYIEFDSFFLEQSKEDLEAAIELWPEGHLAYENLGDTNVLLGKHLLTIAPDDEDVESLSKKYFIRAITLYDAALAVLEKVSDKLLNKGNERRRILVRKAIAQFLTEDDDFREESYKIIREIETSHAGKIYQVVDTRFLYYLATWYAQAGLDESGSPSKRCGFYKRGRICVANAIARSPNKEYDYWAQRDPNLGFIGERMGDLVFEIRSLRIRKGKIHNTTVAEFRFEMKNIFTKIEWLKAKEANK